MSRRAEAAILAACLLLFLLLATAWIRLPGPQHDELLHLPVLLPALRGDALYSIKFDGHAIPLMLMSYIGALKGWLLRLWFLVVPMSVTGYRLFGILLGLVAVWLAFRFMRRHYGTAIALLTTSLLATDPTFVHGIRLDYGPVALMHLLKMGGMVLLSRWVDTRSRFALGGGMFLFGLALWDKANFIWFLAALAVTVAVLFPREFVERLRGDRRAVVVAAGALLLGAAPFVAFNLHRGGSTWTERGRLEVRWFKLLQAQSTFDGDFMQSFAGEDMLYTSPRAHDVTFPRLAQQMYRLGVRRHTIILPLLGLALLLLSLNLWIGRRRALLFPLLLSLLTYAAMFLSFEGGASAHHVVMLQPFPLLFLAASLWTAAERWPRFPPRAAAVAAALAAVGVNLAVHARQLAIYTRTGGTGGYSDAVYRLVPHLTQQTGRKIYALDWGFSYPVAFLGARWNLRVDDISYSLSNPGDPDHQSAKQHLAELMRHPNNVFLLHSPQRTVFPAPASAFFALLDAGIGMRQEAVFQERSGEVIYEVYRAGSGGPRDPAREPIRVEFTPERVAPEQKYVIRVPELAGSWIDLVYHIDQVSSGTAMRMCQLDATGRAEMTVPPTHPAATVRVTRIRPSGGEWRPASGSITVVR